MTLQRVESTRITDERQELGQDISKVRPTVSLVHDVALDLRFASAERNQRAEGEELTRANFHPSVRRRKVRRTRSRTWVERQHFQT